MKKILTKEYGEVTVLKEDQNGKPIEIETPQGRIIDVTGKALTVVTFVKMVLELFINLFKNFGK